MLKCQQYLVFNIYEKDKFQAQLNWAWKKFYNLGHEREKCLKF